ncbi:MAG TPA: S53 family peptidase [Caulobacteraceae bacterium]|jgi:subtilase family serine protease|nr:S53 family peptidase [Caulobacteraceae bacterium]
MQKIAAIVALSGIATLAAPFAFAQAARVEQSGRTFHVAVCPGIAAKGTARCHAHVVTDSSGNVLATAASPNVTPSGFSPSQLKAAYKIGATSKTDKVAIVDAYGYPTAESDLAVYRAQYGLPPCTTANGCFKKINQSGGTSYPRTNTGWDQEQALDLDMVSAMCPTCKILLVEATTNSDVNLGTAVNEAAALRAHVISNSYGGGESGTQSYEAYYDHPGVAITVSTGDSGYGAQFPATSPHVTAVGGTSLTWNGTTRTETAWSGGGSGCSTIYAKPTWQTDTGCRKRMEADVSAVADPNTGVAVYGPGHGGKSAWLVFGGTSVAAPLIGGLYGALDTTVTYDQNPYQNTSHLNDVTSGSNGSCSTAYFCHAGKGYDGPTGLGTPNTDAAF